LQLSRLNKEFAEGRHFLTSLAFCFISVIKLLSLDL